jgi:hypothetical protein
MLTAPFSACRHNNLDGTSEIKFSGNLGQRVKAFLFQWNVDLKNPSFEPVDQKIFKQVSSSYLGSKASPNMLFLTHFFCETFPLRTFTIIFLPFGL